MLPQSRCLLLALVMCAAWLCTSAHALAQGAPERTSAPASETEPPGYRELVAEALSEYEAGHFEESRALMLRAHALFPNARTLRGLGMVSFELRQYAESVEQLSAALGSEVRPLSGELRSQTEALLTRARSFVARLSIQVQPAQAELLLDGAQLAREARGPLLLSVGEHALEARAAGYLPEQRTVRVMGGEELALSLVLAPLPQPAAPPSTAPAARSERRAWYKSPWFWLSSAVVIAGVATGIGLAARSENVVRPPPYRGLSGEPPLVGPAQ